MSRTLCLSRLWADSTSAISQSLTDWTQLDRIIGGEIIIRNCKTPRQLPLRVGDRVRKSCCTSYENIPLGVECLASELYTVWSKLMIQKLNKITYNGLFFRVVPSETQMINIMATVEEREADMEYCIVDCCFREKWKKQVSGDALALMKSMQVHPILFSSVKMLVQSLGNLLI